MATFSLYINNTNKWSALKTANITDLKKALLVSYVVFSMDNLFAKAKKITAQVNHSITFYI